MKRLHMGWLTCLLLATTTVMAADSDAILGRWYTTEKKSVVEITKKDGEYNGIIASLREPFTEEGKPKVDKNNPNPDKRAATIEGMELMWGFTFKKKGVWVGGRIYDPDNGKTYYCKIKLKGETLTVRGSLDRWGLVGRTVKWVRAK